MNFWYLILHQGPKRICLYKVLLSQFLIPRVLIFIAAFLPQFIDTARPLGLQFALIVPTFLMITFVITSIWALAAGKASGFFVESASFSISPQVSGGINDRSRDWVWQWLAVANDSKNGMGKKQTCPKTCVGQVGIVAKNVANLNRYYLFPLGLNPLRSNFASMASTGSMPRASAKTVSIISTSPISSEMLRLRSGVVAHPLGLLFDEGVGQFADLADQEKQSLAGIGGSQAAVFKIGSDNFG